jgi:hypothetical protein
MVSDESSSGAAKPVSPRRRRTAKVAEAVARETLHDIVDRGCETGTRPPSETDMAAQYGIARASCARRCGSWRSTV